MWTTTSNLPINIANKHLFLSYTAQKAYVVHWYVNEVF